MILNLSNFGLGVVLETAPVEGSVTLVGLVMRRFFFRLFTTRVNPSVSQGSSSSEGRFRLLGSGFGSVGRDSIAEVVVVGSGAGAGGEEPRE